MGKVDDFITHYNPMSVLPCKRSGYCCKLTPCKFGVEKGSPKLLPCKFLGGDKPGEHFCSLYDWIITQPKWELEPAFGKSCLLPTNPDRKGL